MTLYMFRTVFPSIIRSSRLYIKQQAFVKHTAVYLPAGPMNIESKCCVSSFFSVAEMARGHMLFTVLLKASR